MSDDDQKKPFGKKPFRKDGERRPAFPGRQGDGPSKRGQRPDGKRPLRRPVEAEAEGERIAKRLARAGIASRRDAEELIAAGRVKVNGRVLASPAVNVMPDDRIEVDNTEIPPVERTRLFLFHKPAGLVTTNRDPEGRRTVFDVLPDDLPRLITIGRLDINTEGLLLLTNDGGLARLLELPATGWLRRYRARVHGKVDEKALPALKDGLAVDGVFYGSIEASLDREQGANAWMTIGLREGKNREVKNILGALGLDVTRLIRISYGPFQLGELKEGEVQEIKGRMLRDQLGERLIEESGANFDAPIIHHRQGPSRDEGEARPSRAAPSVKRDGERGAIGEGGLIKRRKRREDARGDALARLDTKPAFQKRPPRGEGPDRDAKPAPSQSARKANVWMAPGARPQGSAKAESADAKPRAARAASSEGRFAKSERPGRDRPDGGGDKPFRPRPRPEGERAERPERSERPRRFDGAERPGRAERSGKPPRFDTADRPAGDRKPFRDRNAAPAGDKPFRPRPRPEAAGAGRPERSERPRRFERSERTERPAGDKKPFRDRNAAPGADKPRFRQKPDSVERPASSEARPRRFDKSDAGGKPFKPRGSKPDGERGVDRNPGGRGKPQNRPAGGGKSGDRPRPSGPKRPRPSR